MDVKDRTSEFQRSVMTYRRLNKKSGGPAASAAAAAADGHPVSEFQRSASLVAGESIADGTVAREACVAGETEPIVTTTTRSEIAELSFLIKRKIYSIEQQLVALSQASRVGAGTGQQGGTAGGKLHSSNVVNLLNKKMQNVSGDFKSVLEARQRLELSNRDRWGRINDAATEGDRSSSNDGAGVSGAVGYNSSNPFMSSLIDEAGPNATITNDTVESQSPSTRLSLPNSEQQLMLIEEGLSANENLYLQERNRAVETIESTIQEVGNLFQQLGSMVQEQGEVIQRIDANVGDIDLNIGGAQRELLKYFDRVKSNRWLAAKIFFIIFVFFLFWVLLN
ncbi:t-SNARE syntaxin KNAG_0A06100 [Huiozyma naganishii CBS 8797]|uniref:t-SNARE coiled-coil homology domain-containing protein n=1 Tax=Huiozyma naganishii (strain ATCC MYA-139 / BCRC 22969 / CBS 8797 / KCTC 17520 / NBRC 10181 / NCYC 3082 / Yp74L-3) TaxID=1071383 RepID=J7RTZ8_HUIN7|nr:hypothetical protein KNAG_0A06100 [Kazachstania naganishii CBS 8797]CCK68272.1 hypothetical protein KNAG_0A06100 [Kazachstania naganishii CBS 8797]